MRSIYYMGAKCFDVSEVFGVYANKGKSRQLGSYIKFTPIAPEA